MSTPGSPYGELPPTHDAEIGLDVKDPHEHPWFTEPTEKVSHKHVGAFAALIGALVVLPIKKVR